MNELLIAPQKKYTEVDVKTLMQRIKSSNALMGKNKMATQNHHLFHDTSIIDTTMRNKNDSLFKLALLGRAVKMHGNEFFIHKIRESGNFYTAFVSRKVEVELHSYDDNTSWGFVDINDVEFYLSDNTEDYLALDEFRSLVPLHSLIDNIMDV